MIPQLERNRQAVIWACERFGVKRLYVFGSSLREDHQLGDSDRSQTGCRHRTALSTASCASIFPSPPCNGQWRQPPSQRVAA